MSRAHPPVLVRLPTSCLAAVIPAVIDSRGYLPGICLQPDYQPQKGKPLHAASLALEPLREGLAMPASDRTLRGAPLPGFVLVAGARLASLTATVGAFPLVARGKTPVACGKSADGKSAPPLSAWHWRQYGTSSRHSCSGPSLPSSAWSASRSAQSEASSLERSTAHRKSR
jgi:hypothetical protein